MPEPLSFRIGGISIALSAEPSNGAYARMRRFGDFICEGPADIHLSARCGSPPPPLTGRQVFESGQGWRLFQDGERRMLHVRSADQDPYQLGIFTPDFRMGEIYVPRLPGQVDEYIFPLGYPLGELFMVNVLGSGLGILQHACGVVDQGEGMVFTGISSAGKTTTARLWQGLPGVSVLNDDRVILRKVDGNFRVFGTPWHGQGGMALPLDAPLKRIFILKHAPENVATRLSVMQAVSMLLVRCFAPLWDPQAMQFTLQLLEEMCQSVPCYELGFVPDSQVVDFVRCLPN